MAEDKKILENEAMTEGELDQVAGGTREEFKEICKALGKSATWNTRDGIRKVLEKDYGIKVVHWNTGDRCSAENAPAEFEAARKLLVNIPNGTAYIFDKGSHIEYKDVIEMITKGVY